MAYKDVTWEYLKQEFGIDQTEANLFHHSQIKRVEPSVFLQKTLKSHAASLPLTETIISEAVILPILLEVQSDNDTTIGLLLGNNLPANRHKKLNGQVDFMFIGSPNTSKLVAPFLTITEAEFNNPLDNAWEQCAAQMLGIRVFNQSKKSDIVHIYGVVTDGNAWRFMKLIDQTITIDTDQYYTNHLGLLLGVFQRIINQYVANAYG